VSTESNKRLVERESPDGSLQSERDQTHVELAQRRAATALKADRVLDRADAQADQVVQAARDLADQNAEPPTAGAARKLTREREGEDDAVQVERERAEESLRLERQERKRALAGLLRREREATDEHLLVERGKSDHALDARDHFLALVSHDLRTLLGGIALATELLDREAPRDQIGRTSVRSRAASIQRSVARMNRLIGDLIDVASIEAGKFTVEPVAQDLTALVREEVETFELAAAASRVRLVSSPRPSLR
jgi:signal transduction histidine kinase